MNSTWIFLGDAPVFLGWAGLILAIFLFVMLCGGEHLVSFRYWSLVIILLFLAPVFVSSIAIHLKYDSWTVLFMSAFIARYMRLLGHFIGYWMYEPSPSEPRVYNPKDVTVILPTIHPDDPGFNECVTTILRNNPYGLIVVTVGKELRDKCKAAICPLIPFSNKTVVQVGAIDKASKRRQIAHALPYVETNVTVLVDDHVFWPSQNFLASLLAPMDSERVATVTTPERVRRISPGNWSSLTSIVNFIACNYLERHNWELQASNALDGGVFAVPGPTCVFSTDFLVDPQRLQRFCNEKFFFGLFGGDGLGADDNNFLTREAMCAGIEVKYQNTQDALMETTLGEWPKFNRQLLRWARTTFRSNPVMLRNGKFFDKYPWTYFMVYLAGLINFALLWDGVLLCSLSYSPYGGRNQIVIFLGWLALTKTVKILPHLCLHPEDVWLLPYQLLFGYYHSFIKLWALITFYDCGWSGRNLKALEHASAAEDDLQVVTPLQHHTDTEEISLLSEGDGSSEMAEAGTQTSQGVPERFVSRLRSRRASSAELPKVWW